METEDVSQYRPRSSKTGQPLILPELDIFVHLLILLRMLDEERMDKVRLCNLQKKTLKYKNSYP